MMLWKGIIQDQRRDVEKIIMKANTSEREADVKFVLKLTFPQEIQDYFCSSDWSDKFISLLGEKNKTWCHISA